MPLSRCIVRVDPQGQSMAVDILDTSGVSVAAYESSQFAAERHTLPLTIEVQTDFCLAGPPGPYDVSCKVGGTEVASDGGLLRVQADDVPVLVVPDWPRELTASPSAASGAMSSTKIAQVSGPQPLTPQTATHGTFTDVDFTGSTIVKGAAYWGVPDSALDLDVTIVGGTVRPPQADCQYDIWANVTIACDLADAGKLVGLLLQGNNQIGRSWAPVRSSDGIVLLAAEITDQVFVGDQANIGFAVDAQELTVDASVSSAVMFLVQR